MTHRASCALLAMIVCLCHRVSDRDIERAVHQQGVRNFDVLQDLTRVSSCCGCCRDCAREVFDSACARAEPSATGGGFATVGLC